MDSACDPVVKSGSDREQEITAADCIVGGIGAVHADISNKKRMQRRDGASSHDGCDNRDAGFFHYLCKLRVCPGDIDAAACQKERLFRLVEKLDRLFQLPHMDAGIGLVAAEVDGLRVFCRPHFRHDIFGKVHQYRTRAAGAGNIEGFLDDSSQIGPLPYGDTVFGDISGDADNVHLLESVVSNQMLGYLTGKTYKRHAVIIGCGKSGDQVGSARTAGDQTDADLSGCSCIGIRFMGQRLLMPGKDNSNIVLPVKLIADINRTGARIAKYNFHAFFF